ncbi:MAG: DUF3341 domain-containing protein [Saprospiraceae bacterium]|nr:DUF3341 domain-containing protein [Saprospiraceae bacterium]
MKKRKDVIYGIYSDEDSILNAVRGAKEKGIEILDVYSPFPVHGLDPILGLKESRLHIAGFFYGLVGTLTAFLGMTWIFTKDWPIIFGGKPYWAVPSFIPITFELTVLFAAIGMTVSFYVVSGMGFGVENFILDERISDDKFCLAFDKSEVDENEAKEFLKSTNADEIHEKIVKS